MTVFSPILELSDRLHWDGVIRETFSIALKPKRNRIPSASRVVNSNILLVGCKSSLAKPNWTFGIEASVSLLATPDTFSEFPAGMTFLEKRVVLNRLTLVHFASYQPQPYLLTFSFPHWHKEMYVEAWSYSGPQSSTVEETLGEILTKVQQ